MSLRSSILVVLQIMCLGYLVFFTGFIAKGWWVLPQLLGVALSGWAVIVMRPGRFNIQPEVKQNALFITKGPYGIIRNPMYAGLILYFGGVSLDQYQPFDLLVYFILIVVLILKIFSEEYYLTHRFGESYETYKKNTYRLIPFLF